MQAPQALSIRVVDVANGVVATAMRVDVVRRASSDDAGPWLPVVSGRVGSNGVVSGLDGPQPLFDIGVYELRLHVGDYFRLRGTVLPEPAFMEVQVFRFGIADASQHHHLPVKLTPWGLSCFRGA